MQTETPPTDKPYDKPEGERRGLVIVNTGDGNVNWGQIPINSQNVGFQNNWNLTPINLQDYANRNTPYR